MIGDREQAVEWFGEERARELYAAEVRLEETIASAGYVEVELVVGEEPEGARRG